MSKLTLVLEKSKQLGFLGPGPIQDHIIHSLLYTDPLRGFEDNVIDLGAGGGIPSLPLLWDSDDFNITLLDTSRKRCSFLLWATSELGVVDRTKVVCERAEEFGAVKDNRQLYSAVIARGFGPPAMTLEYAAPLLRVGGRCIISEPPSPRNWPRHEIEELGLRKLESEPNLAIFESFMQCEEVYPRPARAQNRAPVF